MKIVFPSCCGVDVHKSFLVATIIETPKGSLKPGYQKNIFLHLTLIYVVLLTGSTKRTLDVCMESTGKYWVPVFNILEKRVIIAIARMILTAVYSILSPGEIWNPVDLFKVDLPEHLKEQQRAKTVKHAIRFLESQGLKVSYPLPASSFCLEIFLCFGAGFLCSFEVRLLFEKLSHYSPSRPASTS